MGVNRYTLWTLEMAIRTKACLAFAGLSIMLTGASASAATFSYNVDKPQTHQKAGVVTSISTSFNDTNQLFNWSSTFGISELNNSIADGAWLVVNDGPNPRSDVAEQVIFYLDGLNKKVSAYNYPGTPYHWQTATHLGTKDLAVSSNGEHRTFSFNWDMSGINAMTDTFGDSWKGTAFDEKIGIWFHGIDEFKAEYDADDRLSSLSFSGGTAFDITDRDTVVFPDEPPKVVSPNKPSKTVPEPSTAIAFGITAAAATLVKSRKLAE